MGGTQIQAHEAVSRCIAVLDVGTTAVKACLFSPSLELVACSVQEYALRTQGERVEADAAQYKAAARAGLADALSQAPGCIPAAVSITTQGETLTLADRSGEPLRPFLVWLDSRAENEAQALRSVLDNETFYKTTGLPEATGAWIVNATTGEMHKYTIDTIPEWVDRIQPESFILTQINNKGEFVHGWLNFADRDKFRASQGHMIIYNNDRCYLFTGLTSVGSDESAIGFILVDMVTKESNIYQMSGATEMAAQSSAEGKVQQFGYRASFPMIINLDGQDITGKSTIDINKAGIARTFQNIRLFHQMSVLDNVKAGLHNHDKYSLFTSIVHTPKYFKVEKTMNEEAMKLLKVFDLDKEADILASNLPYGKQRKLEIARALATKPKLLLLDEPAAGMNPNETEELMDTIRFVRDNFDMTILLIEHDMKLVSGICEELTVLNFGHVLRQGKTSDVLHDPEVIKAYLGE